MVELAQDAQMVEAAQDAPKTFEDLEEVGRTNLYAIRHAEEFDAFIERHQPMFDALPPEERMKEKYHMIDRYKAYLNHL